MPRLRCLKVTAWIPRTHWRREPACRHRAQADAAERAVTAHVLAAARSRQFAGRDRACAPSSAPPTDWRASVTSCANTRSRTSRREARPRCNGTDRARPKARGAISRRDRCQGSQPGSHGGARIAGSACVRPADQPVRPDQRRRSRRRARTRRRTAARHQFSRARNWKTLRRSAAAVGGFGPFRRCASNAWNDGDRSTWAPLRLQRVVSWNDRRSAFAWDCRRRFIMRRGAGLGRHSPPRWPNHGRRVGCEPGRSRWRGDGAAAVAYPRGGCAATIGSRIRCVSSQGTHAVYAS